MESKVVKGWQAHGLHCAVVEQHIGIVSTLLPSMYYCGYVRVDEAHPWYEVGYSDLAPGRGDTAIEEIIDVHGGVTFSAGDLEILKPAGWWFGFDCAHAYSGGMTLEAVIAETERMAQQLSIDARSVRNA